MSSILQISDTHIVNDGALVSSRLDTAASMARLIARIASIRQQIGTIDAVLMTGDLSDSGSEESYARFKSLIAPLDMPVFVIAGNHDARAPMRAAFADHMPADGPLNWVAKIGCIKVIGLDTLIEGAGSGALSEETLEFLKTQLKAAQTDPVLLALHHPPFLSGVAFMDKIGLSNRDDFRDIVATHAGPLRILCGHIHFMMVAQVGGHIALSAPSVCSTFNYDRRSNAPVGFVEHEGGCLLHRWDDGFQTIRIGAHGGSGPHPF